MYTEKNTKRFMARVSPEPNTGCWLWTGVWDRDGYGQFSFQVRRGRGGNKTIRAHHASLLLLRSSVVPPRMEVDHKCRVRCCVNPDHLRIVTHEENMASAQWKLKTSCPSGHPFNEANTYWRKQSGRHCRICVRDRMRRIRAARKEVRAA